MISLPLSDLYGSRDGNKFWASPNVKTTRSLSIDANIEEIVGQAAQSYAKSSSFCKVYIEGWVLRHAGG